MRRIFSAYRASLKQRDNFWTEVLTRPWAAVLLVLLDRTPITPNQVTFLSLLIALGSAATLVAWLSWPGLVVGACLLQLSYIFDCVDGQLARLRGIPSPIGHLLDFLMDEIKAFVFLAAIAIRLFLQDGRPETLLFGLAGLVIVASGISITTFIRRPEYLATGRPPSAATTLAHSGNRPPPRTLAGQLVLGMERFARFLIHYPSWLLYVALFDQLRLFLYVYVAVHALYLLRAFFGILIRLGRPGFKPILEQKP